MKILSVNNSINNNVSFSAKNINSKKILAVAAPTVLAADSVVLSGNNEDKRLDSLLKGFTQKVKTARKNNAVAFWELNVNSSPQKEEEYETRQKEYFDLYRNEELYKQLLEIDSTKLSAKYSLILKDLIKNFQEELCSGEEIQNMRKNENAVLNKFNSYVHTIDGNPISLAEILRILETEKDCV